MSDLASYVGSRSTSRDMIDHIDTSVDNGDYDMTDIYNVNITTHQSQQPRHHGC